MCKEGACACSTAITIHTHTLSGLCLGWGVIGPGGFFWRGGGCNSLIHMQTVFLGGVGGGCGRWVGSGVF